MILIYLNTILHFYLLNYFCFIYWPSYCWEPRIPLFRYCFPYVASSLPVAIASLEPLGGLLEVGHTLALLGPGFEDILATRELLEGLLLARSGTSAVPQLEAPDGTWVQDTAEMIDYCEKKNIPVKASVEKPYSSDENCLHISYEAGKLEELDVNGVELVDFGMTVSPQEV